MRIRRISIENLGSIETLTLEDIGAFTVVVGKNGSGKTFLFEALRLFFSEFRVTAGHSVAKDNGYLWHNRNTEVPVTVSVRLEPSSREETRLLKQINAADGKPLKIDKAGAAVLDITRTLTYGEGWSTTAFLVGGERIVVDNSLASTTTDQEQAPIDLSSWRLELFDPGYDAANIEGRRLLVDERTRRAYYSEKRFDDLGARRLLEVTVANVGKDHQQWCAENGMELVLRPPTADEATDLWKALEQPAFAMASVPESVEEAIRGCFQLVAVGRDSRGAGVPRSTLLDADIGDSLRDLSISTKPADERKWHVFKADCERIFGKSLEGLPTEVFAEVADFRLPLAHLGGGEQALISLRWRLEGAATVVCIEEPESHLHPGLVKKWFNYLKTRSADAQLIMSTHSPLFVDKSVPQNNFLFRLVEGRTEATRVADNDQLVEILTELGLVPSDFYYRDLVVFVEGGTEKLAVFPIWGETLGVSLGGTSSVGLISVGGDTRLKDNLRIWLEVAEQAPAEYLVVLDGHAGGIKEQVVKEMEIPSDKIRVLSRHCVEDYYLPLKHVVDGLRTLWGIDIDEQELNRQGRPGEDRARLLQSILEREGKIEGRWKVLLGQFVASRMTKKDIDADIKDVFEEIRRLSAGRETA